MPLAVLLTPPTHVPGEVATLAALCSPQRPFPPPTSVHVRKPGWSRGELAAYLRDLPPAVRARVVLHSHHDLAAELGVKGVHFTEALRASSPPTGPSPTGLTQSASLHALSDIPRRGKGGPSPPRPSPWSYVLISPVWPSVSKAGYGPAAFSPADLAADLAAHPPAVPVLALGGLTPATARLVSGLGCAGAAALGSVWAAPDREAAWAAFAAGLLEGGAVAAAAAAAAPP